MISLSLLFRAIRTQASIISWGWGWDSPITEPNKIWFIDREFYDGSNQVMQPTEIVSIFLYILCRTDVLSAGKFQISLGRPLSIRVNMCCTMDPNSVGEDRFLISRRT